MEWIEAVKDKVGHHFATTGKAFLLANVKRELESREINLQEVLMGRKLKEALEQDGSHSLRLIRNPLKPLVWGLVPVSAELTGEIETLFAPLSSGSESLGAETRVQRFGRGVWLAFARPIKPGFRRYLEIGPPSKHWDVGEGVAAPPTGVEVDPTYIYDPLGELLPNEQHSNVVEDNIKRWASSKKIAVDKLLATTERKESRPRIGLVDFSNLSMADKARILIPLDLIEKIKF